MKLHEMLSGEVALMLGVHPLTITRWASSGKIKYRLNRHGWKLFNTNEVEKIKREREADQLVHA